MRKKSDADVEIETAISTSRNFCLTAGAGSGKTSSLVNALLFIKDKRGSSLRRNGEKIACITYTNIAVDVIKRRVNADDLFMVSTIHGFLWSLICEYHQDMILFLETKIIPSRIEKKMEDCAGESKKAKAAVAQVERLNLALKKISALTVINYDSSGRRDYANGRIDHDDVIDLASEMITSSENLRNIIALKYPYILIDEAQDIFPQVMDALNLVATDSKQCLIGYFGDPMQQIFEKRVGKFEGPPGYAAIGKKENYRCSVAVINLLNKIRSDIEQIPSADEIKQGDVKIRLIPAEIGKGPRKVYNQEQLDDAKLKFESAVDYFNWNDDPDVKYLFLTRQMIAHRNGFGDLNKLFTGDFASRAAEDNFKEGKHYLLQPFLDVLVPLVEARRSGDEVEVMRILRRRSPIMDPMGQHRYSPISFVFKEVRAALNKFEEVWNSGSNKEILVLCEKVGLIDFNDRLRENIDRPKRIEEYDEVLFAVEKGDWLADAFFEMKSLDIIKYKKFILDLTPYSTQHGVKGDQFKKVMVIFDDIEANWSHYSFSKTILPNSSGKLPTDGQKEKSLNLAYVCFSRAQLELGILLYTTNPVAAKKELEDSKLFLPEQISIQK